MYKFLSIIIILIISTVTSSAQEIAWYLKIDRSTDTKYYDRHDISTQNNRLVLDFSEFSRNRIPLKVKLTEDAVPESSFSFFTLFKTDKGSIQNSVIVSNKQENTSDGWEIRANELGGWEWNLILDKKIVSEYKTTSPKYAINDGGFHQIGFSYDYIKNEIWLYFDGEHLGIINIKEANMSNFKNIFIGGIGVNEKTSFDGYFKSFYLFKDIMNPGNAKKLYTNNPKYKGSIGSNATFYNKIKVLTWNVSDGGTTYGNKIGLKRTLRILKDSDADIISLHEARGSLEYFAEELGFYFYSINDNISILSRFPIKKTLQIFTTDKVGAIEISISKKQSLYFFNIALDNKADWSDFNNRYADEKFRLAELESRGHDIKEIMEQINIILKLTSKTSIILSGELNYISAEDENGDYNSYPASKIVHDYGYIDSYREFHPNSRIYQGYTRNIESDISRKGRVDYILYKGSMLQIGSSNTLKKHPIKFPSSNFGVLTEFIWKK